MTGPDRPGLRPGITVLEASAGTGKTHRVSSEAVRAVADGTPLHRMLLVTFTIAATSELRSRVWQRLTEVTDQLDAHGRDGIAPTDELAAELADRDDVDRCRTNLADAVATFDAATITTIHGFCLQVLQRLGFAADSERDPVFVEDLRDLRDEVVDDLLVRKLLRNPDGIGFSRTDAVAIADKVITNPRAPIVPDASEVDRTTPDGLRVGFAAAVRHHLEQRKRRAGILGYDDLLLRVAGALADDPDGAVRDRLRSQFSLVIVDEFQDTDAVQWEILERAFAEPPTRLVLVGDPKQAIYSFRGADVHAYLSARHKAPGDSVQRLDRNWRSDPGLLRALDALFGTESLGHDEIVYTPTRAAIERTRSRLAGTTRDAPLRLRLVPSDHPDVVRTASKQIVQKRSAVDFVAADLAADIVRLLDERPTYADGDGDEPRLVHPGDIAVLVGRNQDALTARDALVAAGVPAVVNGTGSVFATPAARAWLSVLEAVERPTFVGGVRSAALTSLIGWTASQVDAADERAWDDLHERLHDWGRLLAAGNVAAMAERVAAHTSLPERLLAVEGGERELTDLRHLADLLHEKASEGGGTPAVIAWLRERIREAADDTAQGDRSRRLETDARAVQVWTVHRSKGLEYPIVYVPFLWTPTLARAEDVLVFHDDERHERVIDVTSRHGERAGARRRHAERYIDEQTGEHLRLAYVALTRAQSQVVLWWVRGDRSHVSPLARLVCNDSVAPGGLDAEPADAGMRTAAELLRQRAPDVIAVETASGSAGHRWSPGGAARPALDAARFTRDIDRTWRRTSYSALTAAAHDAPDDTVEAPATDTAAVDGTAPEHDERGLEDERMPEGIPFVPLDGVPSAADDDESGLRSVPSPFGDIGGGAAFGTLVHGVLEDLDFAAPDLPGALRDALAGQYLGRHADLDRDTLVAGLDAAVRTPLGPLVDDLALRDVDRRDRLDELHFELPLVGGDEPTGTLTMAAIAAALATHLPDDDPLGTYHERLAVPSLATEVRGYLSGSIDVVLRHGDRFVVIDHKSNWLGVPGEELSAWHYRPDALREAMVRAHYPLQALLYTVALHRYLRWRLPIYDPALHLGGVLYLFLRGMTGPDVPRVDGNPCGVFSWRPPAALVIALSDALDGVTS